MTRIAVALVFAFLSCGFTSNHVTEPPSRYDHNYDGLLTVKTVTAKQIMKLCRNWAALSCAVRTETSCTIYIRRKLRTVSRKDVKRHEIAHCNGWGTPTNQHPL